MNLRAIVLALVLAMSIALGLPAFGAQETMESWRSDWGTPWAISVNPSDGSCWVGVGTSLKHLNASGAVL
ncbi:MAG: hypothetical protein MUQ56_08545, partial [Thermoleophilia bacterium]|nr:hypothetical protein [Thermoleophilia bacterium]